MLLSEKWKQPRSEQFCSDINRSRAWPSYCLQPMATCSLVGLRTLRQQCLRKQSPVEI